MIINNIEIQNFGIYSGRLELDLTPSSDNKPIILIGGKNGSGKSTLFEAIKLCIYGQRSLNRKLSQADYQSYLKSRINWLAKDDESTFIKLSFNIFRENIDPTKSKVYTYDIYREWYENGSSIKENFSIYEDGQLLDMDSTFWQDFIEEIIPQGVIDLFFFDGEKIQNLAESGNEDFEQSIKSLLNLAIIPSLSLDLQSIYRKHLEETTDKKTREDIKQTKNSISNLIEEINNLKSNYATLDSKSNITKGYIRKLEERLKKEGGEFYSKREELKQQQAEKKLLLNQSQEKVSLMYESTIPLMLAPKLITQALKDIESEIKYSETMATKEVLKTKKNELEKQIKKFAKDLKIDGESTKSLCDKISGYTSSWIEDVSGFEQKLNLNPSEARQVYSILQSSKEDKKHLKSLFDNIERLQRDVSKIDQKIELALESDVVIKIHEELNNQFQVLGSQERDAASIDSELNKKHRELAQLKAKLVKIDKLKTKESQNSQNLDRIDSIRLVLAEFEKELTKQKLIQLEDEIYDCYSRIHRKSGFIKKIQIEPNNFEVKMFDQNQKIVPVDKLSAGEKQIYAISVLWALSKLSGKGLPMIIDTPLGRLDSQHRTNLVKNFFPNASHQVVILSTDTEIDSKYFQDLNKAISHTYSIDFNLENNSSALQSGYFFQGHEGANL